MTYTEIPEELSEYNPSIDDIKALAWLLWLSDDYSPLCLTYNDSNIEYPWIEPDTGKIISDEDAVKIFGADNIRKFILDAVRYIRNNHSDNYISPEYIQSGDRQRKDELRECLKDQYNAFVQGNVSYQQQHPEIYEV